VIITETQDFHLINLDLIKLLASRAIVFACRRVATRISYHMSQECMYVVILNLPCHFRSLGEGWIQDPEYNLEVGFLDFYPVCAYLRGHDQVRNDRNWISRFVKRIEFKIRICELLREPYLG